MDSEVRREISTLKERNRRVGIDKAWETSRTRRIFIASVTYGTAVLWLYVISEHNILLKAVVPTAGYLLSTLSLPILKRYWITYTG